jgi:hypothetical protein
VLGDLVAVGVAALFLALIAAGRIGQPDAPVPRAHTPSRPTNHHNIKPLEGSRNELDTESDSSHPHVAASCAR